MLQILSPLKTWNHPIKKAFDDKTVNWRIVLDYFLIVGAVGACQSIVIHSSTVNLYRNIKIVFCGRVHVCFERPRHLHILKHFRKGDLFKVSFYSCHQVWINRFGSPYEQRPVFSVCGCSVVSSMNSLI